MVGWHLRMLIIDDIVEKMKKNQSTIRSILLTIPLALLTFPGATLAEENIQESCNAYYEVKIVSVNGEKNLLGNARTKIGEFYAQGGCDESVPNKCRRRARDSAQHCMNIHLYNNELDFVPAECQQSNHIYDYIIGDIKSAVEFAACSLHPDSAPDISTIIFSVYSVTEGEKGCGPDLRRMQRNEIIRSYSITCERGQE